MSRFFVKIAAAAFLAAAAPAWAQVQEVDPNQAVADQGWGQPADAATTPDQTSPGFEWNPAEEPAADAVPVEIPPPESTTEADVAPAEIAGATATQSAPGSTVPRDDVFSAAEGLFGRGAEGLAGILENILRDQGEPTAYISGQEAGGAFIFGLRYGSGTMHHQIEGDRPVYWTGPSVGFDVGADANKVFVLVYNLHDSQQLFKRFPGAEGNAYFVGGFTAQYLRRGDVVLIPIRLGVGLRLGVNAGYMRFSERNRWLPF
jgi:hypothetical protein